MVTIQMLIRLLLLQIAVKMVLQETINHSLTQHILTNEVEVYNLGEVTGSMPVLRPNSHMTALCYLHCIIIAQDSYTCTQPAVFSMHVTVLCHSTQLTTGLCDTKQSYTQPSATVTSSTEATRFQDKKGWHQAEDLFQRMTIPCASLEASRDSS